MTKPTRIAAVIAIALAATAAVAQSDAQKVLRATQILNRLMGGEDPRRHCPASLLQANRWRLRPPQ